MAYTTIKKPTDYFNTKLYTGTGASNSQTVGFQPDFCWFKGRNQAYHHYLFDSVRGVNKAIYSSLANAETTQTDTLMSFDSNGFTLGTDSANGEMNSSGNTFASWNWRANGAGSANTDGSISSTVSANTTSGFSIVSYTGTGSAGTIGHGLGGTPDFWMTKARSEIRSWYGWHTGINLGQVVNFNTTNAAYTDTSLFTSNAPTSTVYNVGTSVGTNNSGITFVTYLFRSIKGFSKFGSYTGNGNADGTFVYTGFKPAFVILKRTDSTSSWDLYDNKRLGYNVKNYGLFPDLSNAESTTDKIDILSNGFKMRTTTGGNYSGATYIYMAFAEQPLVGDNPATAR